MAAICSAWVFAKIKPNLLFRCSQVWVSGTDRVLPDCFAGQAFSVGASLPAVKRSLDLWAVAGQWCAVCRYQGPLLPWFKAVGSRGNSCHGQFRVSCVG
eukprot:12363400-Alexandrium_andersonii.AAC.1